MRGADESVLGTHLSASAIQRQRRQTIAFLTCDGLHASPARTRKGSYIHALHLARYVKLLAKLVHEAFVTIGILAAQHMVHVQDKGCDAIGNG